METATEEDTLLSLESSDEDLSFSETPPPASLSAQLSPVRIVKPEDLQKEMDAEIDELAQVTRIPSGSIRIVLDIFNWDKEKILETTLYGESFLMLREMGIIFKAENGGQPRALTQPNSVLRRRLGDCLKCRERPINEEHMVFTACDHWFCKRCMQQHVRSEVEISANSHFKCPYIMCRMYLDDSLVTRAMPGPLFDAFLQLCVQDFVVCSKYRQMCPTKGCDRSAYLDVDAHTKRVEVQCDCGATYCFGCGELWHYPLTCEQLKKWTLKFGMIPEYSRVVNIQRNKMPCPHCSVIVNHSGRNLEITCSTCNFTFCWSCLYEIKWSKVHQCGTHLDSDVEPEVLGFAAIQRDFETLKDKFSCFDNIDPSLKNLDGLKFETTSGNLTDRVCNTIFKSQRLLSHAYVYTYFLENNLMKHHFFKQLHKYGSLLDKLMEEFETPNETTMTGLELEVRMELAILLHTISDGLENDLWHFKKFVDFYCC